ncbi:MAG TPA: BON domain-containing protein [Rhizomicrobium sp.]|nr:BON domain-containing protein [Rhizomicrobium sp.]
MPQNPRYGRSRYDWDDERDRNYGRGRDDWRDESRSYRSSRYQDEGDHDNRQDRDYQGTLRAGDYGRYEEEEGRSYPERFQGGGRRASREYGEQDFGGRYGSENYGGYGRSGAESYGGYSSSGQSREYSGRDYGRDYGSRESGNTGRSSSGRGYGYYGGYTGSSGGSGQSGGFGEYVSDHERRYGSGSSTSRNYGGRGDYGRDRDWWDRATDEVSSWFGDKDAERRRQADEHRGRGPKNYSRSDDRIREDVSDRLTDDPLVDASEIDVNVSNQEVTLSGTVHTRRQKRLAEDCAESVSGVKHVQNNLRVKQPSWSSGQSGSGGTGQTGFGTGGTTTM